MKSRRFGYENQHFCKFWSIPLKPEAYSSQYI
jgi:hypothetical protein